MTETSFLKDAVWENALLCLEWRRSCPATADMLGCKLCITGCLHPKRSSTPSISKASTSYCRPHCNWSWSKSNGTWKTTSSNQQNHFLQNIFESAVVFLALRLPSYNIFVYYGTRCENIMKRSQNQRLSLISNFHHSWIWHFYHDQTWQALTPAPE